MTIQKDQLWPGGIKIVGPEYGITLILKTNFGKCIHPCNSEFVIAQYSFGRWNQCLAEEEKPTSIHP